MDTRYIQEFVTLADCLSYSRAAESLFIAQPTLSKHMQALEQDLGVSLFERTTRSVRLSRAGCLYLPYARKILSLCNRASAAVEEFVRSAGARLGEGGDAKKFPG